MRLFGFLRNAENEACRGLDKESIEVGKDARTVLIRELIEGEMYEFGKPWQLTTESLSVVVPILRKFDRNRDYLVIQEIPKDKIFVTDSGRINKVTVALKGVKKPVFVRAGTIFKGQDTQSRTSGTGVVLQPKKENLVDVFCVHVSHRISARSGFSTMIDVAPRKVEDALISPFKNQAGVWRAAAIKGFRAKITRCPKCGSSGLLQTYEAELVCVQCGNVIAPTLRGNSGNERVRRCCVGAPLTYRTPYTRMYGMTGWRGRDNLVANLDEMTRFNLEVEKTLSYVPADLNKQVGAVIIDSEGVLGLEMFDHPDSWRAFSRSIVRNYADILVKERNGHNLFKLEASKVPDAIRRFLQKAEELPASSAFKNNISETQILSGGLAGEYTTLRSDVIHLVLKRKTHVIRRKDF